MKTAFGTYQHVCIIGCDGMGAFHKKTETPNIDFLFKDGATTFTALAANPSVSAQGWTSLLTGATPEAHRLTNYDMHPIPEIPTIFRLVKNAYPDAETAAYSSWSPIPLKIISPEGGMTAYEVGPDIEPEGRRNDIDFWLDADAEICNKTVDYLDSHTPKLLFVQFLSTDAFGHRFGYGSSEQLRAIRLLDSLIGKIVEKHKEKGIFDNTLFIVTADHGGTMYFKNGGSHGGWTDDERFVFLGVAGKNVCHGEIGESCIRDIPAIVLHALGIKAPDFNKNGYAAQLPVGIFECEGITNRIELYPNGALYNSNNYTQPQKGSAEYIGNFINETKIKFWQTFEDGFEDVTGNCKVSEHGGIVKRYNDGLLGKYCEFGNGALKIEGVQHSGIISVGFWFKTNSNAMWLELLSNRNGKDNGFSIALTSEFVIFCLKNAKGYCLTDSWIITEEGIGVMNPLNSFIKFSETTENSLKDKWTHFLLTIDTTKNKVFTYVNFRPVDAYVCDSIIYGQKGYTFAHNLSEFLDTSTLYMGLDKDEGLKACKLVDDIIILDGEVDVKNLERYYKSIISTED